MSPRADHPLTIGLVSQEYPPETARGGIGSQTWTKARGLADRGHAVHVISSSAEPADQVRVQTHDGVIVHRIQPPGFEFPVNEPPTFWLGYSWAVARQLAFMQDSIHFDVLDFAEYGGEGFVYQLDRDPWSANWTPVVVQLHGPLSMFAERIGWPKRGSDFLRVGTIMEDVSIKHADALMACSANIADFTAQYHGMAREAIHVVHCGVDCERFRPGPPLVDHRPTVLFVGNIAANKGILTVFQAVLALRARIPAILLRIVGRGDDELVDELKARAGANGASHNFDFVGFLEDRDMLPALYRDADVFCSPADHEVGVANVYIEALASGCPVVAGDTGGAPEAVEHERSGLLVRPGDEVAVANALTRILDQPRLHESMARAARTRAEEYFAVGPYVNRVLDCYHEAIVTAEAKRTNIVDSDVGA
jgi:glycosyltransferase involved in cell wall biosynthesis